MGPGVFLRIYITSVVLQTVYWHSLHSILSNHQTNLANSAKLVNALIGVHNGDYFKIFQNFEKKFQESEARFETLENKLQTLSALIEEKLTN